MPLNVQEIRQIGPYPVERYVAEGGMAWVFLVVDPRFETHDVLRALKLLKPEAAEGDEFERFKREAGLLARIDHPNLVTIFDFGKDEATGCFFYTMAFVDGPSLSQRIREGGTLEEVEAVRLFDDLLSGLAELHRRGIVHRDIKPANVLIGADGRARVADLGIARSEQGASRTRTGTAVGTVLYMAPEQARGRDTGPPSDVFSAGLTLYEALTGRVVYDAVGDIDSTSSHDVLMYLGHLSRSGEEIEVDFTAGGGISKPVADVIRRACRFSPEDRYANAGEMREALLAVRAGARRDAEAGPRSRLWLGGVAGVALLGIAAAGWWFWTNVAAKRMEERSARELLAEVERLDGLLPTLLERARDLPAPPERELLETLDDRMRSARSGREKAGRALAAQDFRITGYEASSARDEFAEACRQLTAGFLGARSEAEAAGARTLADGLRQAGAAEHLPDGWKALEQRLSGLEAPTSADCDLASAHLDRIASASTVLADARALEGEMQDVWPRLADAARDKAERQRELANAEAVDAPEYAKRIAEANEAFTRGSAQSERKDYLPARDAFSEAAKGYEDAVAIVPAARLRAQVRKLEKEGEGTGFDPGRASLLVADADRQYATRAYPDAARIYQEALDEMKKGMKDAGRRRVAEEARVRARVAREAAAKDGAEQGDAARMTSGDQAFAAGEKELAAGAFDRAEVRFEEAETAFTGARKGMVEALADARELERSVREGAASCKRFESDTARDLCAAAERDLGNAGTALAERRVTEALRALRSAESALEQASSAERQFVDTKQFEPEIRKRTPQRAQLDVHKDELVKLAVEASDQNKSDQLRYSWRFDGRELPGSGPRVEFRPEGEGRAEVIVDDGRGGRAHTDWQIAIVNRKPTATLTPSQSTVKLEKGSKQVFSAKLEDPDGDPVTALWKLDGKQVGEGASYTFDAAKPGPYRLALIATDSGGASRVVERSIQVAGKTETAQQQVAKKEEAPAEPKQTTKPEEPPVVAKTTPAQPVEPPKPVSQGGVRVPSDLGIPEAQRRQVAGMFERYRHAIQNHDMDRFKDVWVKLDLFDEMKWKSYFDRDEDLDVRIVVKKVIPGGDETLDVLFEQTLVRDGKPETTSLFGAKLLGRSTGDWQIAKISRGGS